jgi:MFS transporter, FSR family, fosmidomycin resistance protein
MAGDLDRRFPLRYMDMMLARLTFSRDSRVNTLIGTGHFLSHFYVLCLPPMFLAWQKTFNVSFWELGLSVALMSGVTAVLQTPVGFMVDRWGARPFLVGGTLLMTLSMSAMGLATAYWQILLLCALSGVGNSVIHPADYAILTGSVNRARMGSSFALHTFSGNLGFSAAPLVTASLMAAVGWRGTLLIVGLVGIPLVFTILLQSRILQDQQRAPVKRHEVSGAKLLLTRSMLLFFIFFLLSAMAGGGITAWLITVLREVRGFDLSEASSALMAYVTGATGGILIGGWVVDRTTRHLTFAVTLTVTASFLILLVALQPMGAVPIIGALFLAGIMTGASRTPRDVMVKDAAPPGQIGKVFGFVSAGLPLGQALVPVPFGFLIDTGRPDLLLVLAALLLLGSMAFAGSARASAAAEPVAEAAD